MAVWAAASEGTLTLLEVGEDEDLGWGTVGELKHDAPPIFDRADPRPESACASRGAASTRGPHSRLDHGWGGQTFQRGQSTGTSSASVARRSAARDA